MRCNGRSRQQISLCPIPASWDFLTTIVGHPCCYKDGPGAGLAVGDGVVWALGANRDFFYRSGIEKNTGTHWLRVEQPKDSKIVFKQMDVDGDTIVATDKDNNIFYKFGFSKDIKGNYTHYVPGE